MSGQSNTAAGIKVKIQLVQVLGYPFTTITDVYNKFITPNLFITNGLSQTPVFDVNSSRDPDYFREYKVLRTKIVYLAPDSLSGVINVKQFAIGLKPYNYHIKTNDNTTSVSSGQMFMIITADRGNSGGTASTLNGLSIAAASTGANLLWNATYYFYDN